MPMTADQSQAQTATLVDLGAIFVSLELSRSTWLVTALSPRSEKMSRHTITGGDIAGLFSCFAALRQKAKRRKNTLYPMVVIQEAGLDGFWLGRMLSKEAWIESHIVEAASIAMPRRHRRAKTDHIDGETLIRALIAWKRGEPTVSVLKNSQACISGRSGRANRPSPPGAKHLEHFRFSPNRENALSVCFYAIPDAKPLRTFAGIALEPFKPI